jgi:transposase
MRQKSGPEKQPAEDAIRDIRRATRRHFSAEEKIHRPGRAARRGEHSRALPPRGHRLIDVLWLVEGVP